MLNPQVTGNCLFGSVTKTGVRDEPSFARTYHFGASIDPHGDPLSLALLVHDRLRRFASHAADAKSKEAVTTMLNSKVHENVASVMDVLTGLQLIEKLGENKFLWAPRNGKANGQLSENAGADVRSALYKADSINSPHAERQPIFRYTGFRIDFDLAFA